MDYQNCTLCPRHCGADRSNGQLGFCRCGDTALVAKAILHHWEEPALAGRGGSGAIFFGGCSLGCKYCQNAAISGTPVGEPTDSSALRKRLLQKLQLPEHMSANAMLQALNLLFSKEEIIQLLEKL